MRPYCDLGLLNPLQLNRYFLDDILHVTDYVEPVEIAAGTGDEGLSAKAAALAFQNGQAVVVKDSSKALALLNQTIDDEDGDSGAGASSGGGSKDIVASAGGGDVLGDDIAEDDVLGSILDFEEQDIDSAGALRGDAAAALAAESLAQAVGAKKRRGVKWNNHEKLMDGLAAKDHDPVAKEMDDLLGGLLDFGEQDFDSAGSLNIATEVPSELLEYAQADSHVDVQAASVPDAAETVNVLTALDVMADPDGTDGPGGTGDGTGGNVEGGARDDPDNLFVRPDPTVVVDMRQEYARDAVPPGEALQISDAEREGLLKAYELSGVNPDDVDLDVLSELLAYICSGALGDGAILVFLPGWFEISSMVTRCNTHLGIGRSHRVLVLPLHSEIPIQEQRAVFHRPPKGVRKIILSTNIAETSITVDDVVFVVDAGKVKRKTYDAYTNISTFQSQWVSQASAAQRRGRAGRCQPGVAFALYSKKRLGSFSAFTPPEILETSLEELCLQVKVLVESFVAAVSTVVPKDMQVSWSWETYPSLCCWFRGRWKSVGAEQAMRFCVLLAGLCPLE